MVKLLLSKGVEEMGQNFLLLRPVYLEGNVSAIFHYTSQYCPTYYYH